MKKVLLFGLVFTPFLMSATELGTIDRDGLQATFVALAIMFIGFPLAIGLIIGLTCMGFRILRGLFNI